MSWDKRRTYCFFIEFFTESKAVPATSMRCSTTAVLGLGVFRDTSPNDVAMKSWGDCKWQF